MIEKNYINTKEAAKMLHKTPETLRNDRYLKRGVSFYKIGKKVFYAIEDIQIYIKASKIDVNV